MCCLLEFQIPDVERVQCDFEKLVFGTKCSTMFQPKAMPICDAKGVCKILEL